MSIFRNTKFISANITCTKESIARFTDKPNIFNITGDIRNTAIGEKVDVTCKNPVKLFTKDKWDGNDTDNILNIICRPDKYFDVPDDGIDFPKCLAKCPAEKPQPNATAQISLDITRTNDTEELWEGEKLW